MANVQVSVQLVRAVVPVLSMVMVAPNALVFCGEIAYKIVHLEVGAEGLTVRAMVVVAVTVPEVPVMVTVEVPAVAVALAVKVSTLVPVVGLVPNAAVTPLGRPDAVRVTPPVVPLASVTVMVSVALAPGAIDKVAADAESARGSTLVTVRVKVIVTGVSAPEVPVTVTEEVPEAAVALAVRVSTLEPVVGLVPNAAVTPLGSPDAEKVTLPVNPFTSVTLIVSAPLAPWETVRLGAEAESVKLDVGLAVIVSAIVVVTGVSAPELPVMVIVALP